MNDYREIGTVGQHTVQMSLADLREIASKEVSEENKILRAKLDLAIEALKFYSDSDCYKRFGRDNLSEIEEDGGDVATEILGEIRK